MKTLILYCYEEEEDSIINLSFFLKHGVIKDPKYTYIFLINNMECAIKIKETNNIKVVKRKENDHYLLSYKWYLNTLKESNPSYLQEFDTFYFINCNCIGPFLPTIVDTNWIELFNKKLINNDLIAPIIDFPPDSNGYTFYGKQTDLNVPFLHLYMFGTKQSSIDLLFTVLGEINSKDIQTIIEAERKVSSYYLLHEKQIHCLLLAFRRFNINDKKLWKYGLWNKNHITCYETAENYFGLDINPLEVIFVRNIVNKKNYRQSNISRYLYNQLKNYITWY